MEDLIISVTSLHSSMETVIQKVEELSMKQQIVMLNVESMKESVTTMDNDLKAAISDENTLNYEIFNVKSKVNENSNKNTKILETLAWWSKNRSSNLSHYNL